MTTLLEDISTWCSERRAQGKPARVGDYFREHDLCPVCKGRTPACEVCERCKGTGAWVEGIDAICQGAPSSGDQGELTGRIVKAIRLFMGAINRREIVLVDRHGGHPLSASYVCTLERLLELYDEVERV